MIFSKLKAVYKLIKVLDLISSKFNYKRPKILSPLRSSKESVNFKEETKCSYLRLYSLNLGWYLKEFLSVTKSLNSTNIWHFVRLL